MIIGNGMLANAFRSNYENSDVKIFASGVSNSNEFRDSEFIKEKNLFLKFINSTSKVVYFSTCSIYDSELQNSPYVVHKLSMENLVSECTNYLIIRLPQVIGNTENPNTLINFFYYRIIANQEFEIWNKARRVLIDVEDVFSICDYIIRSSNFSNKIINVAHPYAITIIDLVKILETISKNNANYKIIEKKSSFFIDTKVACSIAKKLNIVFDREYTQKVLKKYYE